MTFRWSAAVAGELDSNPFKDVEATSRVKLYVAFLFRKPRSQPKFPLISSKERLEAIAMHHRDVFIVSRRKDNGFYGFPNNFIEKELGVSATSRNLSTLTRIIESIRHQS